MKIIVVAHPSRHEYVWNLRQNLDVHLVWDTSSALSGHTKALEIAATYKERCIVMEDDAIPVEDFCDKAQAWFDRFPDQLLSFYLGTGRPPWAQPHVDDGIKAAEFFGKDYIYNNRLLHGVCYSLPVDGPKYVLSRLKQHAADFAIGSAWGRPTVYPIESLVEHRDTTPVERHPDGQQRAESRVARKLAGKLMYAP